jgi:membrane associated rhomboid family serine protease
MAFYSSGNRFQKEHPVVFNLIIFNVIVWLAQSIITHVNLTQLGAMHYYKSAEFKPFQVVTSMFMHQQQNPAHLFLNMVGLYFFGAMLERVWGSKRFFSFYLICGIGANILSQFTIPYSAVGMANELAQVRGNEGFSLEYLKEYSIETYSSLGASGALMGVLAAAAYLFPNTQAMIMFIPVPIKLKFLVLAFVLYDLFGGLGNIPGDNVGHFAHLGGALIGFLMVLYWNKTNKKTFY